MAWVVLALMKLALLFNSKRTATGLVIDAECFISA